MTKGKMILIGTIVIIFVVTFLFINNSLTKGETSELPLSMSPEIQAVSEMNLREVEEISSHLYQKDGFFEQVNAKIEAKGYSFQMMVAIYSKNDIRVKYVLVNKDATEFAQEDVKSTFYESVENNNLDTSSFNLKIGDSNDGPEW
ncbi:Uncharacterised protein [Lysinibacillus sphaericus]|nr:Uncharacterised protein [Lysinibacillus sphaericus]